MVGKENGGIRSNLARHFVSSGKGRELEMLLLDHR